MVQNAIDSLDLLLILYVHAKTTFLPNLTYFGPFFYFFMPIFVFFCWAKFTIYYISKIRETGSTRPHVYGHNSAKNVF